MIGKTLGHYQITNQIGKGGMGEVFQVSWLRTWAMAKLITSATQQKKSVVYSMPMHEPFWLLAPDFWLPYPAVF